MGSFPANIRLFLDANVLVSGLRGPGVSRDLLVAARGKAFIAVVSEYTLAEAREVMDRKLRLPPNRIERALTWLRPEIVPESPEVAVAQAQDHISDPKDAPILAAALAAKVEALVTGDAHFFTPAVQARVWVLTPREALDRIAARESAGEEQ
jgi:putative PIN family toxin of toxin-antitoxin system